MTTFTDKASLAVNRKKALVFLYQYLFMYKGTQMSSL